MRTCEVNQITYDQLDGSSVEVATCSCTHTPHRDQKWSNAV